MLYVITLHEVKDTVVLIEADTKEAAIKAADLVDWDECAVCTYSDTTTDAVVFAEANLHPQEELMVYDVHGKHLYEVDEAGEKIN